MSPLVDQLRRLKDQGVPFDTAWAFATGGNRRDYFQPTDRDDGTFKPADRKSPHLTARGEEDEPFKRFLYRVHRAAYLDLGPAVRLAEDVAA